MQCNVVQYVINVMQCLLLQCMAYLYIYIYDIDIRTYIYIFVKGFQIGLVHMRFNFESQAPGRSGEKCTGHRRGWEQVLCTHIRGSMGLPVKIPLPVFVLVED